MRHLPALCAVSLLSLVAADAATAQQFRGNSNQGRPPQNQQGGRPFQFQAPSNPGNRAPTLSPGSRPSGLNPQNFQQQPVQQQPFNPGASAPRIAPSNPGNSAPRLLAPGSNSPNFNPGASNFNNNPFANRFTPSPSTSFPPSSSLSIPQQSFPQQTQSFPQQTFPQQAQPFTPSTPSFQQPSQQFQQPAQVATPAPPAKTFSQQPITIFCPTTYDVKVGYLLNEFEYAISPGFQQDFREDRDWTIKFDRGSTFGTQTYTLKPGRYEFGWTDSGWDLFASAQ